LCLLFPVLCVLGFPAVPVPVIIWPVPHCFLLCLITCTNSLYIQRNTVSFCTIVGVWILSLWLQLPDKRLLAFNPIVSKKVKSDCTELRNILKKYFFEHPLKCYNSDLHFVLDLLISQILQLLTSHTTRTVAGKWEITETFTLSCTFLFFPSRHKKYTLYQGSPTRCPRALGRP